jgi:tRNA (cmo5U34)-methyltransferase
MLQAAQKRLAPFGDRVQPRQFDLADRSWRGDYQSANAVVTSLAVHHLEEPEKAQLFADVYQILAPGGVFIIADMIDPVHPQSKKLAAEAYDEIVRRRALAIDGHGAAFDFFQREGWNIFRYLDPDDIDKPSSLYDQLRWLAQAGFDAVDVFWMQAGHAIFGGWKP